MTVERGNGWEVHLGDALSVVACADHLVTDPPFGFGSYATDRDGGVVVERLRHHRKTGAVAVIGYPEVLVGWLLDLGWGRPDEWITWWPTNAAAKAGGRHAGVPRQTEHIAVYGEALNAHQLVTPRSAGGLRIGTTKAGSTHMAKDRDPVSDVRMPDVWRDPSPGVAFNASRRLHPNEKPVDLLLKLVALVSRPGEAILDPFCGSGTTGVAALRLGLRFVGVEVDAGHFATAVDRLRAEEHGSTFEAHRAGQLPLLGGPR